MEDRIADLRSFVSEVEFGTVQLSLEEEAFRKDLNHGMLSFCTSLPKSMQTEAALFLMKCMHTSPADGLNFVNYFYVPAWSILFWLVRSCPDNKKPDPKYIGAAKTGHILAFFLHALDDHLADGQLPVTHLALLIRSHSWTTMNRAFDRLARGVSKGPAIVRDYIDDYYSSIGTSDQTESLDRYCDSFRKQMATVLIVPVLLARRMCANEAFARSIQEIYSSFGIAWRLLDDIQDVGKDMKNGAHSAIYVCLDEYLRGWWDRDPEWKRDQKDEYEKTVLGHVLEAGVIEIIRERICSELESAASGADACDMTGLADELRCLLKPLRHRQGCL